MFAAYVSLPFPSQEESLSSSPFFQHIQLTNLPSYRLQLINSLSLSLAMVFAFSSWVLAAISIRWIHTVFASYFKPDPATIVAGLLLWAYLLSST